MKLQVPYGQGHIPLQLPEHRLKAVLDLRKTQPQDFDAVFSKGLGNPANSPTLEAFLEGCKNLLVIVNDATRPTPTARILERLHPNIKGLDFKFIVATGSHRAPNQEEFDFIFGDLYPELKEKVLVHDARDPEQLVFIGNSKLGTPVWFNKAVLEADRIITINSVEPHYFAGYTGGRKSFLPGVAGYDTIETNHAHAMKPEARGLALKGNPVNDDMEDAATMIERPVFSVQAILDRDHNLHSLVCGELVASFHKAVEVAKLLYTAPFKGKTQIVVSVAPYPMDINLCQAQKAIENGKLALKEGGILILVAECRDGVGPTAFHDLLSSKSCCQELVQDIEARYSLGYHKAGKIAEMNAWAEIWVVSELEDDVVKGAKMIPKPRLQEAVDEALARLGEDARLYYLPNGSMTVPVEKN
jgi:lactate racemase